MSDDTDNHFPVVVEGEIGGAVIQTVNARDLHRFLQVGKVFAAWIVERIQQYDFVENLDFLVFSETGNNPQGGRPSKEYAISIDMAKELAMVERNEQGKKARQYFIECERRAKQVATHIDVRDIGQLSKIALQLIDVNRELEDRARKAEEKVEEVRPKSEFFDKFANADGLYTLQNTGRIVTGRPNKFIQELKRDHLFYQGGNLVPRVRYRQMGIFEVKVHMDDEGKARPQTFVTPKGLQYFAEKMGQH